MLLRSPDEYVVASFDAFADGFDAQLVDVLGYDVPEKLCGLIRALADDGRKYVTLDGGCGTAVVMGSRHRKWLSLGENGCALDKSVGLRPNPAAAAIVCARATRPYKTAEARGRPLPWCSHPRIT
ncbi:MAG: hypothetical protein ABI551_02770 [Polyangiaceae bacterium]